MIDILEKIVHTLKQKNQRVFINNSGLAALGKFILYPKAKEEEKGRQIKDLLENYFKSIHIDYKTFETKFSKYHFSSFYTPEHLIDSQINYLKKNNFNPKTILDPSAGNGAYTIKLAKAFPNATVYTLEPELFSYQILKHNAQLLGNIKPFNQTFENFYLEQKTQKFDLVITNIPFGAIYIDDAYKHDYIVNEKEYLVNNYFNRYAPELLTENGISMLLTSKSFLDSPSYQDIKNDLSKFHFVDALRFDNSLFKDEKTKVVTDLIILQNTNSPTQSIPLTSNIDLDGNSFFTNDYFLNKPSKIQGEYSKGVFFQKPDLTVTNPNQITTESLFSDLNALSIQKSIKTTLEPTDTKEIIRPVQIKPIETTNELTDNSPNFKITDLSSYLVLNANYSIDLFSNGLRPFKTSKSLNSLLVDYIEFRDKTFDLVNAFNSITDTESLKALQQNYLEEQNYFEFKAFGFDYDTTLNHIESYQKFKAFKESLNQEFSIALKQLDLTPSKVAETSTKIDLPEEVLTLTKDNLYNKAKSLYNSFGAINLDDLTKTFKSSESEILNLALEHKIFSYDPKFDVNQNFINLELEPFYIVASGNIEEKISHFKKNPPDNLNTDLLIENLNSFLPDAISIDDISLKFNAPFISPAIKQNFLKEILNEDVQLFIGYESGQHELKFKFNTNTALSAKYDISTPNSTITYKRLLGYFINDDLPTIHYTKEGKSYIDRKATILLHQKLQQLDNQFTTFVKQNFDFTKQIENTFNKRFRGAVPVIVDKNFLELSPNLIHQPYPHQIEGTLFGIAKGNALFDHEVGHGKSLTMGMLSEKLIQMNKADRIFIATLKAVSSSLFHEIKSNFPHLNVFQLTPSNFSKSRISDTLNHIKNNPYQIIIGQHNHLQQIPKDIQYHKSIINERLEMIEQDLELMEKQTNTNKSKQILQGLLKRKDYLETKLFNIVKDYIKNSKDLPTLTDLNINCLMVDESHYFKNIGYSTRHSNVKGLNSPQDRKQNLDLEISIRSIYDRLNKESNIYFFSGTPITNSVIEVYALQRYLSPQYLKDRNIHNFDSWASVFLRKSMDMEVDISGNYKEYKRYRDFVNLPELSRIYNNFTHISNSNTYQTHTIKAKRSFKIIEPSENILKFLKASHAFATAKNQFGIFRTLKYDKKKMAASFIIALNLNRKALVDTNLIEKDIEMNSFFTEFDNAKIFQVAKDAARIYRKTQEHKGTVLVCSNIGVFKPHQYNTYDALKKILIEDYKIPEEQIAFAHQYNTIKRKKLLSELINNGTVRIALGSTQLIGTGTNIQKRGVGIIHFDIPYKPNEENQRDGRFLRKGNMIAKHYGNEVEVITYGYKNTSDIFLNSLNKHKQHFIDQLKFNTGERTFTDDLDEIQNLSYEKKVAALIGDMEKFKLAEYRSKLEKLTFDFQIFNESKTMATKRLEILNNENVTYIKQIKTLKDFNEILPFKLPDNSKLSEKEKNVFMISGFNKIGPITFSTKQDVGNYFLQKAEPLIYSNENSTRSIQIYNNDKLNHKAILTKHYIGTNDYKYTLGLNINDYITINSISTKSLTNKNVLNYYFNAFKNINKKISNINFYLDLNLKNIKALKDLPNQKYDTKKLAQMDNLKSEIKKIKSKRKGL